jgi:hypothetical protein
MKLTLKKIGMSSNHVLKIFSVILGYSFWVIMAQNQKINTILNIPVCFYDLKENISIKAPHTNCISIVGNRSDLKNMHKPEFASIHINASGFDKAGDYMIALKDSDIIMQDSKVKLLNYYSENILVNIKEVK